MKSVFIGVGIVLSKKLFEYILIDHHLFDSMSVFILKRPSLMAKNNLIKSYNKMTENIDQKNAKLNLTLDSEFYEFLKLQAFREHLPVATYVKKFLMDSLLKNNFKVNSDEK